MKGTLVDGNQAAEKLTGYSRDELVGKSFLELPMLYPGQVPRAAMLLARNVMGRSTGPDEFVLTRKDGEKVVVEIRTHVVEVEGRSLVLGIARDNWSAQVRRKRTQAQSRQIGATRRRADRRIGAGERAFARGNTDAGKGIAAGAHIAKGAPTGMGDGVAR